MRAVQGGPLRRPIVPIDVLARASSAAIAVALIGCGPAQALAPPPATPTLAPEPERPAVPEGPPPVEPEVAAPVAPIVPPVSVEKTGDRSPTARSALVKWLRERVPPGGEVADDTGSPVRIVHAVRAGETYDRVAAKYLDLTNVYTGRELAKAIRVKNHRAADQPAQEGDRLEVPAIVQEQPKSADDERLGWPEDKALRGLYIRGGTAGGTGYVGILDRMVERGINLIVLDTKDYDGFVTYPTRVPLAVETGAAKNAPIRDLARTIRFAHARGIRVALRVSCFEDEFIAKARGDLAVQAIWKRPYKIGWLDPSNEGAQQYLIDLAKEGIDAGADEIELDYVRYPVLGIKGADFHLKEKGLTKIQVIRDFVAKMHEMTSAHHVPLSLDVFGAIADGHRDDIEMLGQDPALLATVADALSPMVYPSHYAKGFLGYDVPGNHPELVGYGVKGIISQIHNGGVRGGAVIRPWLQAVSDRSPEYGPHYLADEIKQAEQNGALGWLMWNPAQIYKVTWTAVPVQKRVATPSTSSQAAPTAPTATDVP